MTRCFFLLVLFLWLAFFAKCYSSYCVHVNINSDIRMRNELNFAAFMTPNSPRLYVVCLRVYVCVFQCVPIVFSGVFLSIFFIIISIFDSWLSTRLIGRQYCNRASSRRLLLIAVKGIILLYMYEAYIAQILAHSCSLSEPMVNCYKFDIRCESL